MYDKPIGVSILTNGSRGGYLLSCVESFLSNCFYRPLVIGIFDNGSKDDTKRVVDRFFHLGGYAIEWRFERSERDLGCAGGSNRSHSLVRDCEYAIHLESDFSHLSEDESGVGKLWLREAVEFMETGACDYLYLRRMRSEREMMMHWWSQWMPRVNDEVGSFLSCPSFWWSNNPALRRVQALYDCGTLPLRVEIDGLKGQAGWSQPELCALRPTKPWIYRWGMFVHERQAGEFARQAQCARFGSECKYGFHYPDSLFCSLCDVEKKFTDLRDHELRYRQRLGI